MTGQAKENRISAKINAASGSLLHDPQPAKQDNPNFLRTINAESRMFLSGALTPKSFFGKEEKAKEAVCQRWQQRLLF